jgi:hypothetical protein
MKDAHNHNILKKKETKTKKHIGIAALPGKKVSQNIKMVCTHHKRDRRCARMSMFHSVACASVDSVCSQNFVT